MYISTYLYCVVFTCACFCRGRISFALCQNDNADDAALIHSSREDIAVDVMIFDKVSTD